MAFDEAKADRIRSLLPQLDLDHAEVTGEKRMFGGLCFTLNGKMLAGVAKTRIMVRIGDADLESALASGEALPMDFTGRPLRNFAYLDDAACAQDEALRAWLNKSLDFVREHMLSKKKAGKS